MQTLTNWSIKLCRLILHWCLWSGQMIWFLCLHHRQYHMNAFYWMIFLLEDKLDKGSEHRCLQSQSITTWALYILSPIIPSSRNSSDSRYSQTSVTNPLIIPFAEMCNPNVAFFTNTTSSQGIFSAVFLSYFNRCCQEVWRELYSICSIRFAVIICESVTSSPCIGTYLRVGPMDATVPAPAGIDKPHSLRCILRSCRVIYCDCSQ